MDKFGIFNLLSSFLNLSNEKNSDASGIDGDKTKSSNNILDGLLSSTTNKNEKANKEDTTLSSPKKSAPLQANMLNVMTTHDQLVNRVKNSTTPRKKT